jgi:hypothetical protein
MKTLHTHSLWGIPSLREDRLASVIPTSTYAGGVVNDPTRTLVMFRTASLAKARGCVMGFYVDDARFESLWRHPERSIDLFLKQGVTTLIEPDYSLWADMPLAAQLFNVYRTRSVGRLWQEHNLAVIPNLAWSDERSFEFCFTGIPTHAPVVACECRTAGGNDDDRRAFLRGLTHAVKEVRPGHVLVYGGKEHSFWLAERLPKGPQYTLIEAWTSARGKIRAAQRREARERNQLNLFTGGSSQWVAEDRAAA